MSEAKYQSSDLLSSDDIAKAIADWSRKWPREKIYGFSRQAECDRELMRIEDAAKKLFS